MTHHPIPEIGILDVEQFIECQPRSLIGVGEALVEPPAKQPVEFARAATGTPAQAFEASFFHQGTILPKHMSWPRQCGSRFSGDRVLASRPHRR